MTGRPLLIAAGALSVGVHAGLARQHLHQWLPLGGAFVAAAVIVGVAVAALAVRPDDRRLVALLAALLAGMAAAYAATRLAALPPLDPAREGPDPLGLLTSTAEAVGALLGLRLVQPLQPSIAQGGTT